MSLDVNFPGTTSGSPHSDNGRLIEGKQILAKFVYDFKPEWDVLFESFDDFGISCMQFISAKKSTIPHKIFGTLLHMISLVFTYCSTIELCPSLCLFFYMIAKDKEAHAFAIFGFIATIFSQIPKRFLYRKRPYLTNRAIGLTNNKTSSFPSRAVFCGYLYGFLFGYLFSSESNILNGFLWGMLGVILSSFGRIYLGAHYPSDCIFGALFSIIICFINIWISQDWNILGCQDTDSKNYIDSKTFMMPNLVSIITIILGFLIVLIISNIPPLNFWEKSGPMLASYALCFACKLAINCSSSTDDPIFRKGNPGTMHIIMSFIISQANAILSMISSKLYKKMLEKKKALTWVMGVNILIFISFILFFGLATIFLRLQVEN